jgi:DNA processing protein
MPTLTLEGEERLARLRLAAVPGLRADRLLALLSALGSAAEALRQDASALASTGCFTLATSERLLQTARGFDPESELRSAEAAGIRILFFDDPEIPDLLKSIPDPPILLYCLGSLRVTGATAPPSAGLRGSTLPVAATAPPLAGLRGSTLPVAATVAIVGSRRCTPYGAKTARRLAGEAAEAGLTVVSGLARGIDTEAHRATLEAGGSTWAVLGSGLAGIYPRENAVLARRIAEKGGAVLSEFPLQAPPLAEHFPRRNRVISGLSAATVVVEGTETSGALITARLALEQGREVFAVPGPADSGLSAGPHRLLRDGAGLACSMADVLEALPHLRAASPSGRPARSIPELDPEEREIVESLSGAPLTLEELAQALHREVPALSRVLLELEMRGLVVSLGAQRYGLK